MLLIPSLCPNHILLKRRGSVCRGGTKARFPPPPLRGKGNHQVDDSVEGGTLPTRPSNGQVRTSEGHPLSHWRLNYRGRGDCGGSQTTMPEPLRMAIGNTDVESSQVAPGGDAVGPIYFQLGEGVCTHSGGVLGRVLGQVMVLA